MSQAPAKSPDVYLRVCSSVAAVAASAVLGSTASEFSGDAGEVVEASGSGASPLRLESEPPPQPVSRTSINTSDGRRIMHGTLPKRLPGKPHLPANATAKRRRTR